MKIYSLSSPTERTINPYLEELNKYRKAKDWLFAAMKILHIGFRDLAEICGYTDEIGYNNFMKRMFFRKGAGRMLIKSFQNSDIKNSITKMVEYQYELDKENYFRICESNKQYLEIFRR